MTYLAGLGIETRTVDHKAVFTVAQSKEIETGLPGGHIKNLFLKCKKGQLHLVVALNSTAVDLKSLHKSLGSGRLSFGNAELLKATLGVEPGSVTPFALVNDTAGIVAVALDARMMRHDLLNCHPLTNTATTAIARDDLMRFIRATGHEPRVIELSANALGGAD
ncbi:MAG TPA: prolyl-tRNA synthetase associated domain-containing protein [Hyphomicrobiaceae bacterium]|nr:prolyl-tRNA synthetase associated domain-containing protein [Hyphomicrobiaceae bacterium]